MHAKRIASGLVGLVLGGFVPAIADAASCGTVNAPTACSVELAAGAVFTASEFDLLASTKQGNGALYQAADISIDLIASADEEARLTFSKNLDGPTAGTVFLSNAGNGSSFTVTFTIALDPVDPGDTAAFVGTTNTIQASKLGNGSSVVQLIFPGGPNCVASTASLSTNCALSGEDLYEPGIITTLSGNTGNTSILTIRNAFQVTVPEPSAAWAMLASVVALALLRWRQTLGPRPY